MSEEVVSEESASAGMILTEPAHGHRAGTAATASAGRAIKVAAGYVLAGLILFPVYMRLSMTSGPDSDSANVLLMGWDMLHGNVLLHGWFASDVSFYPTEIPQYALLTGIFGLHAQTAHIAAAMTYTLVFLLAVMLARAGTTGRAALVRTLIAGGIMLAPQFGAGVFDLDLSVGHIGTAVPLLLTWLLIDRAELARASGRGVRQPRWQVPVAAGLLLAWVLVADPLVLVVGIGPLGFAALIGFARRARGVAGPWPSRMRAGWYELSLAAAAVSAWGLAWLAERVLHGLGGETVNRVPFALTPFRELSQNLPAMWKVLGIYGANPAGLSGVQLLLALLHLVSVVMIVAAVLVTIWRFATRAAMVDQVLVLAIVVNVALYLLTSAAQARANEIAVTLPFGAALAARTLPAVRLRALRLPTLARTAAAAAGMLVLAGYLAGLGWEVTQRSEPMPNATVASWLQAHHLTYGIGGYWESSSMTVDTGGVVAVRPLKPVKGSMWMSDSLWYDPSEHYANFVILESQPGRTTYFYPAALIRKFFGTPATVYHTGPYTIEVWHKNLLRDVF